MLLDKENPAVFYDNQINKHYEELRRSTFLATSRYDRGRRPAAVHKSGQTVLQFCHLFKADRCPVPKILILTYFDIYI